MKKLVALLFSLTSLLLPLSGYAQEYYTVREVHEQVQARWTQTYQTKWRDITVDVQPIAPDTPGLPVLQVMPMVFQPITTEEETGWEITTRDNGYWLYVSNGQIDDERDQAAKNKKWKRLTTQYYDSFSMDTAYASENNLTLGDALNFLSMVLGKMGIDPKNYQITRPACVTVNNDIETATGNMLLPGEYSIELYPQLRNIPILCHDLSGVNEPKDNDRRIFPDLFFGIRDFDSFSIVVKPCPLKEISLLADDIPLCAYSKVVAAVEEEIQSGHIRKIFDLELGYVLYNKPGVDNKAAGVSCQTDIYYAVPAWRMNCLYVGNPKNELRNYDGLEVPERGSIEYTTLIINAQTGEMQDYMNNRKGCADYTGFISWDEVGGDK